MKYDYIIIGSGIAGLYSAYQLQKRGHKVLILEKNSDPGGRMRSKKIHSDYENIGASFITSGYKHLLQLAEELKLDLVETDGIVNNIGIVDDKGHVNSISGHLIDLGLFKKVPFLQKIRFVFQAPFIAFMSFFYSVPNYSKLSEYDDVSVKDYVVTTIGKEFSQYFLEPAVNNLFSYQADNFSRAMALGTIKFLIKGRQYFSFKKGLEELPIKISQKVETIFESKVRKVTRNLGSVTVTTKDGKNFEAKQVIIAVPGDRVLDILDDPNQKEQEFFSKVKYSSHIKVFCESNDKFIKKYDRIVFTGKSNIASSNVTHRHKDYTVFSFGIPDKPAKRLIKENKLSNEELKKFIKESINFDFKFEVKKPIVWESALPIFYPGYIRGAYKFKQTNTKHNQVIYVGDYLSGPFLEGAILSAVEVFKF